MKNKKENKTIQTSRKKVGSRFLALVGCLLLVSVLALPCFADYSNGSFEPVVGTISVDRLRLHSTNTYVDLSGWYRLEFTNDVITAEQAAALGIADGDDLTSLFSAGTAYAGFYEGGEIIGWQVDQLYLYRMIGGNYSIENEGVADVMAFDGYLWVKDYPLTNVYDSDVARGAWSIFTFDTYRYEGGSVTPDVPDVPSVPGDADKVTTVWTGIMSWIVDALASVQSVFYVNGSLTFIGMLSVIGVSISIGFLIIGIVQRFLHLRG